VDSGVDVAIAGIGPSFDGTLPEIKWPEESLRVVVVSADDVVHDRILLEPRVSRELADWMAPGKAWSMYRATRAIGFGRRLVAAETRDIDYQRVTRSASASTLCWAIDRRQAKE
jgi:hypothetical protein